MQIKEIKFDCCKLDVSKTYITIGTIVYKISKKINDIKCIKKSKFIKIIFIDFKIYNSNRKAY